MDRNQSDKEKLEKSKTLHYKHKVPPRDKIGIDFAIILFIYLYLLILLFITLTSI